MGTSFSRIAATYDDTRGGMDRGRRFAAALAPQPPDGRVLEMGSVPASSRPDLPSAAGSIDAVYTVWVLHLLAVSAMMREIRPDQPELIKAAAAESGFTFIADHPGAPGRWTTSVAEIPDKTAAARMAARIPQRARRSTLIGSSPG